MLALQQLIENRLYIKLEPSKWVSVFCFMCKEYGTLAIGKKKNGGLSVDESGVFRYNCFKCKYKAKHEPGKKMNKKARDVLLKMGLTEQQLEQLS